METYVAQTAPRLAVKLTNADGKRRKVYFVNGVLKLEDAAEIENMELQLATRSGLSRLVRKLDVAAAEAIALEHMRKNLRETRATKGTTSANFDELRMMQRDNMLAAQTADPKAAEEMQAQIARDVMLTEGVQQPQANASPELPFQPAAPEQPISSEADTVKKTFANLAK